jgi:hypothetical protein
VLLFGPHLNGASNSIAQANVPRIIIPNVPKSNIKQNEMQPKQNETQPKQNRNGKTTQKATKAKTWNDKNAKRNLTSEREGYRRGRE